ncbi:MAG TPA: acetyltransferase [Anaerolineae bacterium]|nr:acetyltransferase [Anaerolineae bacterium]
MFQLVNQPMLHPINVLILGASGFGQVIADILLASARQETAAVRPIGFLDDNPALQRRLILGLPVLGTIAQVASVPHDAVIVAIGCNHSRQRLSQHLSARGEELAVAIHPTAAIGADVMIGTGTIIGAGAVVNSGARIGWGVILNSGCLVDHHSSIGHYVHVGPGAYLGGQVQVEAGALIGMGAVITPQCRVGAWSRLEAGVVVSQSVPPYVVVSDVPTPFIFSNALTR